MLVLKDLDKVKTISKVKLLGASISILAMSFAGTTSAAEADDGYFFNRSYEEGVYYHPDEDNYDMPKLDRKTALQSQGVSNKTSDHRSYVVPTNTENPYPGVSTVTAPEQSKFIIPYCNNETTTDCVPVDDLYIDTATPVWYGDNPVYGADGSYCRGTEEACMRYEASWQKMIEELHGNVQANS